MPFGPAPHVSPGASNGAPGETDPEIWAAVLILRKVGKRVYACGHQHKVDDWLVDDVGPIQIARSHTCTAP